MARPLSDQKRNAILRAAAGVVAAHGLGGPVSKIAKQAGVAEGTIFTYFADKDALLNALYLAIKDDLALAMLSGLPPRSGKNARTRTQFVWNRYIDWGAAHPEQRKAMNQLAVSDRITPASRERGNTHFAEIGAMLNEIIASGPLKGQTLAFVGSIMEALADTTLTHIAREPKALEQYKQAGFNAFWGAIA